MSKDVYRPIEGEKPKENPTAVAIKKRVASFFVGADPTIDDGTVQKVGLFDISIKYSNLADIGLTGFSTTRTASVNGMEVASEKYNFHANGRARSSDHKLWTTIAGRSIAIELTDFYGEVSFSKIEATVPPLTGQQDLYTGYNYSLPLDELSASYKKTLSGMFGVTL